MTIEQLRQELLTAEARYDLLVSQGARHSNKPGEPDAWALARHAHTVCKQIRSQLTALGEPA
jgi:hypothetical protein